MDGPCLYAQSITVTTPFGVPQQPLFFYDHWSFIITKTTMTKQTNKNGKVCAHVTFLNDRGM